ncbi:hypothetical protein PHYPSEUDO_007512 [Phytophthora pseudosyringae]|uniref:Lysosomal Pro-X carboxypeptidase n=1 Tax=Phytophthora pseudosyringae TaxID=221518 RepID=A0A8T1W9A0_9STRA|nr:hypothetical protein PHYPSEUDO_007512 [Phytophthora pseudosyringae]
MPAEEKTPILVQLDEGGSTADRRARIGLQDPNASASEELQEKFLSPTLVDSVLNAEATETNLLTQCDEKFFTQTLDHFDVGAPTYQQRYFVCDKHFRPGGVMFFYVGNEADVELYLNHTGLMWENADEFGAMLVFAEHRYFGKSVPFGKDVTKHMQYLSTEQTLADYAVLITYLKKESKRDIPVIGFGGSYGGMLGSWLRMKYPHIIDGVIAASAPILSYFGDEVPHDLGGYSQVTTFDASPAAGSAENCVPNVRRAWPAMKALGETEDGRRTLKRALSLCEDTPLDEDIDALMGWARDSFDSMAMGNYPYPSSYIMNGVSKLPAYPMRVACSHLQDTFDGTEEGELELLHAFSKAIGVYYNSTKDKECYQLSAPSAEDAVDSNFWDYIYCAELYGPTTTDGVKDMFWSAPWNFTADNASCHAEWGIDARVAWPTIHYGGRRFLEVASNIVFSNGDYDPCSATGVLQNYSDSVVVVRIEGGAHHLDLMFSNPLDPEPLQAARATEKQHMWKWANEFYAVLETEKP